MIATANPLAPFDQLISESEACKRYPLLLSTRELRQARQNAEIAWTAGKKGVVLYHPQDLAEYLSSKSRGWARPSTVLEFRDNEETVNRRFGTIDLNPPGRRQTIKFRPKIRLTDNLLGWLDLWSEDELEEGQERAPMMWDGAPITPIKRTFVRHADDCGLPNFTPGTIRHFVAMMVRRQKPPVDKEQRDVWLGHDEKRTANAYESFDPDYLADCMQATEKVIAELQKHTKRPLSACKKRARPVLKVVGGKENAA